MPLPMMLGTPFGEPSVHDFAQLVRRLLPDGYASDDSSIFAIEIEAWAVVLHYVHTATVRARANAFPSKTVELLDEWERLYQLADDAVREVQERQARLVAAESARGGAMAERIATALAAISTSATVQSWGVDYQQVDYTSAPELTYQIQTTLSEAEFSDPAIRKAVATVLARMVPARCFGQDGSPAIESSIGTAVATWASATSILGRAFLRAVFVPDAGAVAGLTPPQRVRSYGPGSIVRAADLTAIQDAILRKPATGGGTTTMTFAGIMSGQESVVFGLLIGAGANLVIEDSLDWRKRLVFVACKTHTADIRPGGSSDASGTIGNRFARLIYTGPGDTAVSSTTYYATLDTGVQIYADSTTGKLRIRNSNGTTRYLFGLLACTSQYDNASGDYAFADGQSFAAAGVGAAWVSRMAAKGLMRIPAATTSADNWTITALNKGGRSIVAHVVNLSPGQTVMLDDGIDWRDRVIYATCLTVNMARWPLGFAAGAAGPLGSDRHAGDPGTYRATDELTAPPGSADPAQPCYAIGYTRLGTTAGSFTAHGTELEWLTVGITGSGLRLYADTSTNALMLARDADASGNGVIETYVLTIDASMQIGQRLSPPTLPAVAATDTQNCEPWVLNALQDRSLLGVATGSEPLGHAHVRGSARPYIPEALRHTGKVLAQQRGSVGWARRFFATSVAGTSEQLLDATIDWRDRAVRVAFIRSANYDLLPGHAGDAHANDTAAPVFAEVIARYTGPGGHATVGAGLDRGYHLVLLNDTATEDTGICIYARTTDGALVLRNRTGLTTYVVGWVDASFQLGFRS